MAFGLGISYNGDGTFSLTYFNPSDVLNPVKGSYIEAPNNVERRTFPVEDIRHRYGDPVVALAPRFDSGKLLILSLNASK